MACCCNGGQGFMVKTSVLLMVWLQACDMGPLPNDISDEKLLCRTLMENYTSIGLNGRPIYNMSQALQVQFGLGLIQMDLDEKNKIFTTSMWARYRWNDFYLQWDPDDHGGIKSIKLASDQLWKPDIMLYNTAETDKSEREVLAVVVHDGWVLWAPHQIFRSSCSIDVTNFPFDNQACLMYFGSWTHTLPELDLHLAFPQGIDLSTFMSDYKESCAWDVVNHTAERQALPEDNPSYVLLAFKLNLRRKMVFSSYILTLPCIFLACLTLVVFWLPPGRPDRTSLAMSIFASFLVLLLILVEAAPPTASSVPTLGVYYCFNMVIIMMSIFLSTLVVNICRCEDQKKPVPNWVKMIIINHIGWLFCVRPLQSNKHPYNTNIEESTNKLLSDTSGPSLATNVTSAINPDPFASPFSVQPQMENASRSEKELIQIRNTLQDVTHAVLSRMSYEQQRKEIRHQWRTLAAVLDRTFFVAYVLVITLSLVFLFPRPI